MKTSQYGLAKRVMNLLPGSREMFARAYMALPIGLSAPIYDLARTAVFRDNQHRLPVFQKAFAEVARTGRVGDYLEFGVARGTSLINASKLASRSSLFSTMRFHAFDSFAGLPGEEGDFAKGSMAYAESVFLNFITKAGVDTDRVTVTKGFFDRTLVPETPRALQIDPRRAHVVHIDCDLYQSTKPVLQFIAPLLGEGSVIIFDDWFSFEAEERPSEHGEQRAFFEWTEQTRFQQLAVNRPWNVAWKLIEPTTTDKR